MLSGLVDGVSVQPFTGAPKRGVLEGLHLLVLPLVGAGRYFGGRIGGYLSIEPGGLGGRKNVEQGDVVGRAGFDDGSVGVAHQDPEGVDFLVAQGGSRR